MNDQKFALKKIKSFGLNEPIIFATIIFLIDILSSELSRKPLLSCLLQLMDYRKANYTYFIIVETVWAILGVIIIKSLGIFQTSGITKPKEWKKVWLFLPALLLVIPSAMELINAKAYITSDPMVYLLVLILNIMVGLGEEIIGRSLTLNIILRKYGVTKKGIYFSVFISSIIFGAAHFATTLAGRHDLISGIGQVIYCIFFGVFFSACVLRNNSIWPMVFYHFVVDFISGTEELIVRDGVVSQTSSILVQTIFLILYDLPLLLYGLFLLRKVEPRQELSDEHGELQEVM